MLTIAPRRLWSKNSGLVLVSGRSSARIGSDTFGRSLLVDRWDVRLWERLLLIHLRIRVGLIRAFSWTLFSVGVIFPLSRISSCYSLKNLCKIPPDKWLEDRLAGIAKDQDQTGVQHFHIFPFHQFTSNPNSINTMRNVWVFFMLRCDFCHRH